jgi:hypothetical protein
MAELAAANPTGDVLTFVFPVVVFLSVMLWGFFQRRGN